MRQYRSFTLEFVKEMKETRKLGARNNLPILASSVAFLSIFSLCPLLILTYVASQYFLRQINAETISQNALVMILNSILPSVDSSVPLSVVSIVKQNALSNIFNLALLAWSVKELFECIHTAFANISVRGNVRTGLWASIITLFCFMLVTGASSTFLIASSIDPLLLKKILNQYLIGYQPYEVKIIAGIFGLMVIAFAVTLIFKIMPTQKIAWTNAFRGSVLFILLFFLGRSLYELYAKYYRFMNEGTFGPFFTFIMVIVWIYFVSRAFLFSAQYTIYLEEKKRS